MTTKFCFGNGADQGPHIVDESLFTRDSRRDDGLAVYCKFCAATRQRAWKHSNADKVREAKRAWRNKHK
jgi:hypothetical protein